MIFVVHIENDRIKATLGETLQLLPAKAGRLPLTHRWRRSSQDVCSLRLSHLSAGGLRAARQPIQLTAAKLQNGVLTLKVLQGGRFSTRTVYSQLLSCIAVSSPDFGAGKCLQPILHSTSFERGVSAFIPRLKARVSG